MSYVVLARKWRPLRFRDLVGQEHVSRTLANAIEQGRVAHAFLFTGVRGVGKTTSARILAKALNCLTPVKGEPGGIEPCLACAACREIAEGIDVDVREIDGASYTGVDEIRKLQESLPYRPARDRYKIFIVDEVHMLSQNAWNALLKTLEEPPPHVKFILATTEVHKVPVTILSRVQRFDFKMISSRLIADRIRFVLAEEKIPADEHAIALVAREAAGSMRDALSLLDQVIAFSPERLLGDEVARVLGVAGFGALLAIADAVLLGAPAVALAGVGKLSDQSCDMSVTARDLLGLLRDLVVAKLCTDSDDLLDLSDEDRSRVRELAARVAADDLMRVQQGFAKGFDDVVKSPDPRAGLEMLLARLALRPELVPLDRLMSRLSELEARLGGKLPPPSTGGSGGRPGPPSGGGPRSSPRAPASATGQDAPPASPVRAAPPESAPVRAAPLPAAPSPASAVPPAPSARVETVQARPTAASPTTNTGAGAAPQPATRTTEAPPSARTSPAPAASKPAATSPLPSPAKTSEEPAAADDMLDAWRRVLDHLDKDRPDLVAFLKHSVPIAIRADAFTLGYEAGNVLETSMRSSECLEALGSAALACLGNRPRITFEPVPAGRETLAEADKRAREQRKRAAVHRAEHHPSVREAAEILGARVKRIEIGES